MGNSNLMTTTSIAADNIKVGAEHIMDIVKSLDDRDELYLPPKVLCTYGGFGKDGHHTRVVFDFMYTMRTGKSSTSFNIEVVVPTHYDGNISVNSCFVFDDEDEICHVPDETSKYLSNLIKKIQEKLDFLNTKSE